MRLESEARGPEAAGEDGTLLSAGQTSPNTEQEAGEESCAVDSLWNNFQLSSLHRHSPSMDAFKKHVDMALEDMV